jgi:hypothetical protein
VSTERRFTSPVTDHGFRVVDENMAILPDHVHLGRLPALDIDLDEITVASQPVLDPDLVRAYAENPPKRKRILLRSYWGGDEVAVADGHHAIAAARLRGETSIRARWIDD